MKAKLAILATLIACCGSLAALTPAASVARPLLCERSCGGSWGAREHAEAFAKKHGFSFISIAGCWEPHEGNTQWECTGSGEWKDGDFNNWTVGMTAYGYETFWTQTYY
ncbi:MAG: hypothetical protein ABSB69_02790 [Solirubrobacteraceae bacterium]